MTAIARYAGHLDLFTVGTDNRVYSCWWDVSGGWSGWFRVGDLVARPGSTVNVVSRYSDHLDLFTHRLRRPDHVDLVGRPVGLGSPAGSRYRAVSRPTGRRVTAIARYPFHLDVFTVGTDNRVYSCWWDDRSGWSGWFPLGDLTCRPDSTVTVVARHPDHLDLFTTASDGRIMSTWWDARGGWAGWFQVSGGVASPGSPVTAIARYSNHLDLFVIGTDNRSTAPGGTTPPAGPGWFNISGGVGETGRPDRGRLAGDRTHRRLRGRLGLVIYSTWWDATGGWSGWFQLGVT